MEARESHTIYYDVLAPFGITPDSTMEQILDAGFDLMEQPGGMTKVQRRAWDALRKAETRLVVDFFSWCPGATRNSDG